MTGSTYGDPTAGWGPTDIQLIVEYQNALCNNLNSICVSLLKHIACIRSCFRCSSIHLEQMLHRVLDW